MKSNGIIGMFFVVIILVSFFYIMKGDNHDTTQESLSHATTTDVGDGKMGTTTLENKEVTKKGTTTMQEVETKVVTRAIDRKSVV